MAAKLTRLTHQIAIQLHLVAERCTICSSRSRRPVRKLLDTSWYVCIRVCMCVCVYIYIYIHPYTYTYKHTRKVNFRCGNKADVTFNFNNFRLKYSNTKWWKMLLPFVLLTVATSCEHAERQCSSMKLTRPTNVPDKLQNNTATCWLDSARGEKQQRSQIWHNYTILTISMELIPWEANKHTTSQEIPGLIWNPEAHDRLDKSSPTIPDSHESSQHLPTLFP
jgi:hypothetical protein